MSLLGIAPEEEGGRGIQYLNDNTPFIRPRRKRQACETAYGEKYSNNRELDLYVDQCERDTLMFLG